MENYSYIFLVDLNNAFLSIEAAHRLQKGEELDIRTIPAVVAGSREGHSIVLAKSEAAKKLGIKTAMQMHEVRNLAPNIKVYRPNYNLYMKASKAFVEILSQYGPCEQYSIDEAFVDINLKGSKYEDPVELAYTMKDHIRQELNLTVNVGVSVNKILAKMAAGLKKPNMVHTLYPEEIESKLWPLPVGKLFMVGAKTEKKLLNLGINTIGDLAIADQQMLYKHFKSYANLIKAYSLGIEHSRVSPERRHIPKGIGNNFTSSFKIDNRREALLGILSLVESVAGRLRGQQMSASLIAIYITYADLRHISHQRKISVQTNSTTYIHEIAKELFDEAWDGTLIRKLGVRLSAVSTDQYSQLSLLETFDFERHKKIDAAIDEIRDKFGSRSVIRSSFLHSGMMAVNGGMGQENYPVVKTDL